MDQPAAAGYLALKCLLDESNLFAAVEFGTPADPLTAQDYPLCWIRPRAWESLDEVDPIQYQRIEHFVVEIRIRIGEGQGGFEAFNCLTTLANQTAAALDGQALGPGLPGLTRVKGGTYHEQYPTSVQILEGTFSYLIAV